ncbi:MAG: quinolinate synthase NadA [Nitriliruptor sp.]|nr:MAG: quinolinate synthase NadA [Nitriliruptor sp.]
MSATATARASLPVHPADRLAGVIPEIERHIVGPIIDDITRLKQERDAIVLAHNYMTPDIFHGVADLAGDSLQLARMAADTDASVIVMAGVHFMAETAKILSPDRTVLIPDLRAGCSLAESITPADIAELRRAHPGAPVVTYVNTSAAVKAASDITCTSSNAVEVVRSLGTDKVIFIPDRYLGSWVATQVPDIEVVIYDGACEVHERFTGAEVEELRTLHDGVAVLAHPECPPDVLAAADVVGSTKLMHDWVRDHQPRSVAMITECSMADNVAADAPDTEFIRPCNMCPHMKRITIQNIRTSLETMTHEVVVDPDTAARARRAVEAMLAVA